MKTDNNILKKSIGFDSKVAIRKCDDYVKGDVINAIEQCVAGIGGFESIIGNASNILLKPNLLSAIPPERAVTTHPVFIESIIEIIKKTANRPVKITIADSPGVAIKHTKKDLKRLYEICGLSYLGDIEGVILNLDTGYSQVSFKEGKVLKQLEIIKPVLDADVIINMPKFKTHSLTKMSGAVKNMFGIIHGRSKTLLHAKFIDVEKFNEMLLDVYLSTPPTLNIMDGIIGLEGEGPGASGIARKTGLVLAGTNGIAMDNLAAFLMGFEEKTLPLIKCAAARELAGSDLGKIEISGGLPEEFAIKGYKLPKTTPVDRISKNRFLNTYIFPFIRNTLSVSPYQDKIKCTNCNTCIEVCPEKAIIANDKKLVFDYKKCIRCYCCSELCPDGAIDLKYSGLGNLIFRQKQLK
jgi:uncharacterized protein (DUF362 family)/Pyruvate/2-oxoacid:ferredoxin oxidoreductase delta subunit